jgi:hypothetical protein
MDLFGSDSLRVFYATVLGPGFIEPARIVYAERLGGLLSLFPNPAPCAFDLDMVWNIRCFAEPGVTFIQFGSQACELVTTLDPAITNVPALSVENPASGSIRGACVRCPENCFLVVVDGYGRTLLRERMRDKFDIPLPAGFAGVGFATIADAHGEVIQRLKVMVH